MRTKPRKAKRSLARRAKEPLYILVQPEAEGEVPVSPRFKVQNDPPVWATMVFTERRKAEVFLARTRELDLEVAVDVGTISLRDMLFHIQSTAAIPVFESQGRQVHYLGGQAPEPVDAINVNNEALYPLVLTAFDKVYHKQDPPPYPDFAEAFQALLRRLKKARAR